MDDQAYYNIVALELKHRFIQPGLWTRAVAETGTEGSEARACYIRLRVAELIQQNESIRLLAKLQKIEQIARNRQREAARHAKRKAIGLVFLAVLLSAVFFGLGYLVWELNW